MESVPISPPAGTSLRLDWKDKRIPIETRIAEMDSTAKFGTGKDFRLFHSNNIEALSHLLPSLQGKVDLIYLDPPFDSQATYHQRIDADNKARQYTDNWKEELYLQSMLECLL